MLVLLSDHLSVYKYICTTHGVHVEYINLRAHIFCKFVFSFCSIKWRICFVIFNLKYCCGVGCIYENVFRSFG
jgi:hypothetical protein